MYHKVLEKSNDRLTVSIDNLERQFQFLKNNNYKTLFFKNLENKLPKKSILLTFDDGYDNNQEFLLPLLKKYNLKATIFIPTEIIEKGKFEGYDKMMTFEQIRNLDSEHIEIALHSHSHNNFREINFEKIEKDLKKNIKVLEDNQISYSKILAYPYGKYTKEKTEKKKLFLLFENLGITIAVKIGNKINYFPSKNPYELCRIDIVGTDNLLKYKLKLIFGKLKFF